jgi:hypothetical protein
MKKKQIKAKRLKKAKAQLAKGRRPVKARHTKKKRPRRPNPDGPPNPFETPSPVVDAFIVLAAALIRTFLPPPPAGAYPVIPPEKRIDPPDLVNLHKDHTTGEWK